MFIHNQSNKLLINTDFVRFFYIRKGYTKDMQPKEVFTIIAVINDGGEKPVGRYHNERTANMILKKISYSIQNDCGPMEAPPEDFEPGADYIEPNGSND